MYARVSTKDKGQDCENQLAQLRDFATVQGWTLVGEYVDKATGKNSDRDAFKRLFADAAPFAVVHVITIEGRGEPLLVGRVGQ